MPDQTTTTAATTTKPPLPLPLPPLTTLVRPEQIHQVFQSNEPRAARWHKIFTRLWKAAERRPHHLDEDATNKQQRAHRILASLSRIVENANEKQRARAREAEEAAAPRRSQPSPAAATDTGVPAGGIGFVHLDDVPSESRVCTMCKRAYCVQYVDGEASFRHYPVRLSCDHLLCFACAKALLRMHVNCACCGASFGDGKGEMAGIEKQMQLCGQASVEAARNAAEAGKLTREDVEAALVLLNLDGKFFEMEDVVAGLALVDLKAGTATTLEEYLLGISHR